MENNSSSEISQPSKYKPTIVVTLLLTIITFLMALVAIFLYLQNNENLKSYSDLSVKHENLIKSCAKINSIESSTQNSMPSNCDNESVVKKRLLMTKEFKGGNISAYRPTGDYSKDAFEIILEGGKYYPPIIFSYANNSFMEDGVIEIVENNVWVINSNTNKIDIYKFSPELAINGTSQLAYFQYQKSIELPKYNVGTVYSVKCSKNTCEVLAALHQQSGCSMIYNLGLNSFSDIKCADMSGSFSPQAN